MRDVSTAPIRFRSLLLLRCVLGWGMVGLAMAACEDPASGPIRTWARYWVERQLDTVLADSSSLPSPDSALLDSLSSAWTADDWLHFWAEVEREQALRRNDSAAVATP